MGYLRKGVAKAWSMVKYALRAELGMTESDFEAGDRQRQTERYENRNQKGRPFHGQ